MVIYENGNFVCVTDKLVEKSKITITKEKKTIELPIWSNINKLKAIKAFKEHK